MSSEAFRHEQMFECGEPFLQSVKGPRLAQPRRQSVDDAAPLRLGDAIVQPDVWNDLDPSLELADKDQDGGAVLGPEQLARQEQRLREQPDLQVAARRSQK